MAASGGGPLNGIGFGTWAWGNQLVWGYDPHRDDALLESTFRQAIASGLSLIDTADSYGTGRLNGCSERLLGRFTAALPALRRSELCIATKLAFSLASRAPGFRPGASGQSSNVCRDS